jgi:hypothetical protein
VDNAEQLDREEHMKPRLGLADVGEDWGTPVSPTCRLPSRFTGALGNVTVEVK